jgi:hypothetical protein
MDANGVGLSRRQGQKLLTTTQIYTMSNKEAKRRAVSLLEGFNRSILSTPCLHEAEKEKGSFVTGLFS